MLIREQGLCIYLGHIRVTIAGITLLKYSDHFLTVNIAFWSIDQIKLLELHSVALNP